MLIKRLILLQIYLISINLPTICCAKTSLAFVIDTTNSMKPEIQQVREGVGRIMDIILKSPYSQVENLVLVAFDDNQNFDVEKATRLLANTRSRRLIESQLDQIKPDFGAPLCPEMSLSGIERALEQCLDGSFLFIFTDDGPRDSHKVKDVIKLCQQKRAQTIFVISPMSQKCRDQYGKRKSHVSYQGFEDVAAACSGELFYLSTKTDIPEVLKDVEDKIKGAGTDIKKESSPPNTYKDISFTIDEESQYAIVRATGNNVVLKLKSGPTLQHTRRTWIDNVKSIRVDVPGPYVVTVNSESVTNVTIYARTDFTFRYGFSKSVPRSFEETVSIPTVTMEGDKMYLVISVEDPENSADVKTAEVLDTNEDTLDSFPLREISKGLYTASFAPRAETFKIAIKATSRVNGRTLVRKSQTPVTPLIANTQPKLVIAEGNEVKLAYGGTLNLTCDVISYPSPNITWLDNNFIEITKNRAEIHDKTIQFPFRYQSKLTMYDVKKAGKYYCSANNANFNPVEVHVNVDIGPPFIINKVLQGITYTKYGEDVTMDCDIRSPVPMRLYWWLKDNLTYSHQIRNSDKYILASDNRQLKIKAVDINLQGNYGCTAELINDQNVYKSYKTQLKIEDLVAPRIDKTERLVQKRENSTANIHCKIIAGTPKPTVVWLFSKQKEGTFTEVSGEDVIHKSSLTLHDDGYYKCIADNGVNKDEHIINLKVEVAPVIERNQFSLNLMAKDSVDLHCKITKGYPRPNIAWQFKGRGATSFQKLTTDLKNDELLPLKDVSLDNFGTYKCKAENVAGSDEHFIKVVVEAPPNIVNKITELEAFVNDTVLRIPCEVTGFPEPKVVWFDYHNKTVKDNGEIFVENKTLIITNFSLAWRYNFTCKATNIHGDASKQFKITITDIIDYGKVQPFYILQDNSTRLDCKLNKIQPDKVLWFRNGVFDHEGEYTYIVNATMADDANYTCRGSSKLGSETGITWLLDVGRIELSEYVNNFLTWDGGELTMECEVYSKPIAQYKWFYNGKLLKDQKSPTLDVSDWGLYTCEATNVHSSVSMNYTISSEDCLIRKEVNVNNWPLILNENLQLHNLLSRKHFLTLSSEQKMILSCSNSTFFEKFIGINQLEAKCIHEDKFEVNGKTHGFSEFMCKDKVKPIVRKTNKKCLNENTEKIDIGFNVNGFIDIFEVCKDKIENISLYVNFNAINPLYNRYYESYTTHNEINISDKLNDGTNTNLYIGNDRRCYYKKGQLVNVKDVSYGPAQLATFEDLNEIYYYEPCDNSSSWKTVEDSIRNYLYEDKRISKLLIWSGASNFRKVEGQKIPQNLWKVVKSPTRHKYMVLVHINHPNPDTNEKLCHHKCYLLPSYELPVWPTYCCSLSEFVKVFKIPRDTFT